MCGGDDAVRGPGRWSERFEMVGEAEFDRTICLRRPGHRRRADGLSAPDRNVVEIAAKFTRVLRSRELRLLRPLPGWQRAARNSVSTRSSPAKAEPADLDYLEELANIVKTHEPLRSRADVAQSGADDPRRTSVGLRGSCSTSRTNGTSADGSISRGAERDAEQLTGAHRFTSTGVKSQVMSQTGSSSRIDGSRDRGRAGPEHSRGRRTAGVYIPRLCWMKGLTPAGACRVCTVKASTVAGSRPARSRSLPG